jgi:hypothetical protein
MKEILENRLVKINTYLNDAIEECNREGINYYEGQKDVVESLLKEMIQPLSDWECYEGTLHSADEQCNCEYYHNYDNQQDYYEDSSDEPWSVDLHQIYIDEISWHIQHDTEDMYHLHNKFTSFIGKNVMKENSHWFTSDEIEAFRTIWQRRISAM